MDRKHSIGYVLKETTSWWPRSGWMEGWGGRAKKWEHFQWSHVGCWWIATPLDLMLRRRPVSAFFFFLYSSYLDPSRCWINLCRPFLTQNPRCVEADSPSVGSQDPFFYNFHYLTILACLLVLISPSTAAIPFFFLAFLVVLLPATELLR